MGEMFHRRTALFLFKIVSAVVLNGSQHFKTITK